MPTCEQQGDETEGLQVTLSMQESYSPPPIITVAPPVVPQWLPSPPSDNEEDSDDSPVRETGRRGGPLVLAHIQNANQIANETVGPIPKLLRACFIDNMWECDNSFQGMLSRNYLYV